MAMDKELLDKLTKACLSFITEMDFNTGKLADLDSMEKALKENPGLVTDEGHRLVSLLVEQAYSDDKDKELNIAAERLQLLRRCIDIGVPLAFREKRAAGGLTGRPSTGSGTSGVVDRPRDAQAKIAPARGRWEYKEFSVSLASYTNNVRYTAHVAAWDGLYGGVPDNSMRAPIKKAVQALLNRVSADGWEPVEPLDPDRLWDSKRINYAYKNTFLDSFSGTSRSAYLQAVNLNCRRWVTS